MSRYNALTEVFDGDPGVQPDVWSCPSFNKLARDSHDVERHNRFLTYRIRKVMAIGCALYSRPGLKAL